MAVAALQRHSHPTFLVQSHFGEVLARKRLGKVQENFIAGVSMAELLLNFHYNIFYELLDVSKLKELTVTSSFTLDTNSLLYDIPVLV